MDFITQLEALITKHHLSAHPFYQKWTDGTVSLEKLKQYVIEYYKFMKAFPRMVSRVHSTAEALEDRKLILENLCEEENPEMPHEELWLRFGEGLGLRREEMESKETLPETDALLNAIWQNLGDDLSCGCAAILAYEGQIAEIAQLKEEGLRQHYGMQDKRPLEFFAEHSVVDIEHQKTWKAIIARHATTPDHQQQVLASLEMSLKALWQMLDGIERVAA